MATSPRLAELYIMSGRDHFNKGEFWEALCEFSSGLKLAPENEELLSFRGATYCKLEDFKHGLSDAEAVLNVNPTHVHAILSKVLALIGLRRYAEALAFTEKHVTDESPESNLLTRSAVRELQTIREQIRAQLSGHYDMEHYLRLTINDDPKAFSGCAEYMGPIELVDIPGKGRGYVATKLILAGQLVMVSKAIAVAQNSALERRRSHSMKLPMLLMEKIKENPEVRPKLLKLYAGTQFQNCMDEGDLNIHRIIKICEFNSFSIRNGEEEIMSNGLWFEPSFFNHTCVGLNTWDIILKDFMFIRAVKHIERGEELSLTYVSFDTSYKKRTRAFRDMQFECKCDLCVLESTESDDVCKRRSDILAEIKLFPKGIVYSQEKFEELNALLNQLKEMRTNNDLNSDQLIDQKFKINHFDLNFAFLKGQKRLVSHYLASNRPDVALGLLRRHFDLVHGVENDRALKVLVRMLGIVKTLPEELPSYYRLIFAQLKRHLSYYFENDKIELNLLETVI